MYLVLFLGLLVFKSLDSGNDIYVNFQQSGGFAGITRFVEISSDTLSIEEQQQLIQLIADSKFFDIAIEEEGLTSGRDQFQYDILIRQQDRERSLSLSDSNIPVSLKPLVDYLSRKMRVRK